MAVKGHRRSALLTAAAAYLALRALTRGQEHAKLPVRWRHLVVMWVIILDWFWWDVVCGLQRRVVLAAPPAAYKRHSRLMLALFPHHLIWPAASFVPRVSLTKVGKAVHLDRAMLNAHSALFLPPILREVCIALNFRSAARDVGSTGTASIAVFPGGGLEMQLQRPSCDTVVLRRGFASLAIEQGLPIAPVYLCNETSVYEPIARFGRIRGRIYELTKAGVPLWRGLGGIPLFPLPRRGAPYVAVIGEPMEVGAPRTPTDADVDTVLARLEERIASLQRRYAGLAGRDRGHRVVFDRSRL